MWNVGMKDLQQAREDFDQYFYDLGNHETYLPRHLIPFVERSLLCMFFSNEMAEEMNAFHQHVLKNLVASLLSNDAPVPPSTDPVVVHLLSLLRMILNGHNSCMFFYIKYPGVYSAAKYQKLVYTSYLASPDVLLTIPPRHPSRSFYFVDNVDLFFQAGGFCVILQRLAQRDIALQEVSLFCSMLSQAKPCLAQQKRRRSSAGKRKSTSTIDSQVEDFFRDFLNATFARLRRMNNEELKDDEGLIDHIVGMLDMLYRDGVLLGGSSGSSADSESDDYTGSDSSAVCDPFFAEAMEVFHLDLSKKFICCPFLAQRLLGISRLNDLIAMAQRKEELQKKTTLGMRRTSSSVSSGNYSNVGFTSSSIENQPASKWLRVKYVVEWLSTSDVLEVIMGEKEACSKYDLQEGTHLEILKRSKKIYEFVASNGLLNENHVVLLWKTSMNQLRSGRKTVLDMLLSLCGMISADLTDVVMVLLTQVPLAEYDELCIQFVKRVIMIAAKQVVEIEATGTKKTLGSLVGVSAGSKLSSSAQKDVEVLNKVVGLGCCLLWNAILDGHEGESTSESTSSLKPAMRTEVESALAVSLNYIQKLWVAANSSSASSKEQQKLLNEYIKKCAGNIKNGFLVETSMSLIQRIAEGYGSDAGSFSASSSAGLSLPRAASFGTSSRSASPSDLLKELNSRHEIILLVVEEIKNYMKHSREKADWNSHRRSMRRRLSFLGYIVTRSEVELSYSLIEQVWRCFNGLENTLDEREVFFEWFTGIVPDSSSFVHRAYSGNSAFSNSVTTEIYQSLIKKRSPLERNDPRISLDVEGMGKHAFWSFERLFRFINTSERLISSGTGAGNAQRGTSLSTPNRDEAKEAFVVESLDLKGLETLYEVALCAGNEGVSEEAINYLIYLHLHVGSKLVRREVWTEFVNGCFDRLKKKVSSGVETERIREVHRLLVLLGTFLFQSVVQTNQILRSGGALGDRPEELIVHVRTQDGRSAAPFRYQLRRTSLVGDLRDRIAQDTGHPADRIRILNEFKTKLTAQGHDKFTLEKARIFTSGVSFPSALPSTAKVSSASAVVNDSQAKRVNYVEAIMLSKVESDTAGHVQRSIRERSGTLAASNTGVENDWQTLKADISSNGEWLELLFKLLTLQDEICEEAWKVLKLLASDIKMEKCVRTLNDTLAIDGSIRNFPASFDWKLILDPTCPPKLLYQLELVEHFALCGDGQPEDTHEDGDQGPAKELSKGVDGMIGTVNRWSTSFLKLGGKKHLENFLLACSPKLLITRGTLSVMCLSKLLKILRHFVLVELRLAEEVGGTLDGNPEELIHELLEALASLQDQEEAACEEAKLNAAASQAHDESETTSRITAYARPELEDPDNYFGLPSEVYLMTRALSFISTSAIAATQDALPLLESYPGHGQIFLNCLVKSRFKPVRQESANAVAALSTTRNKSEHDRIACCHFFLEMLSKYDGPVCDEEYYNAFTLLVSSADTLGEFAILPSCRILCRRVKEFPASDDHVVPRRGSSAASLSDASNQMHSSQDSQSSDSLLEALLSTLLTILKRIPPVLAGRLDVPYRGRSLREVVSSTLHTEEGIIDELFHRCLFATPNKGQGDQDETISPSQSSSSQYYLQKPKCRSDSSRDVAFELLTELSQENTTGLRYLLEQMSRQHSLRAPPVPKTSVSSMAPASKRKLGKSAKEAATRNQIQERGKYVGLKNLGCTCYMNSTMQAFFMIPRFRRQILRFNAEQNSGTSTASGEGKSVLYELQSLFAHLEGTAKSYYNPRPFTSALKTWDGESIDVNLQQDASEFLTSFFQQIESEMNGMGDGSGDENILNTFFGGVFSNELVAEGDRYSERAEPFHFISVPVRDRKTLKESLDGWVEGEKVSYTWEAKAENGQDSDGAAGEKVTLDTHKRISISKLPDQLIIHLKRFEFDFERMQQIKLHDRFEFPMELDMYPYTKQGQEEKRKRSSSSASNTGASDEASDGASEGSKSSARDGRSTAPEYSQYELVGTVVHMGTANSGHYYSFLREQNGGNDYNQWYEFNDTVVSAFNPQQIPDECFGGEETRRLGVSRTSSASSAASVSSSPTRMKTRSSFMLIYARKQPKLQLVPSLSDVSRDSDSSGQISNYSTGFAAAALALTFCGKLKQKARFRLEKLRSVAQVIAPEPIRNLIAMENRLFWRKKYLYDSRCLNFTFDVIKSCLVGSNSGSNSTSELPRFEPTEARLEALQMATKFVFGTLWQGGDVAKVLKWKPALLALYHTEFDGCYWLLSTLRGNEQLLLDLLVFNEHTEVRELLASVLSEAIATTSNLEFEEEAKKSSGDSRAQPEGGDGGSKKLPASFEFIFFLFQLMPALLSVPVEQHSQYFMTIWDFSFDAS
uniref:USP domain-containing protein n=1 Tax=Globisporangium ultimum (strain ATCC 200006 / CBS 805.95 / DAOM BR144) TaxID=431595 RepID=K3WT18_GLOUD